MPRWAERGRKSDHFYRNSLSFSAAASRFDGNNGGFNPRFVQPTATIRARRVPLYGWSPSRPRALCNTEEEAATERGAPSGWPQKGSSAPGDSRTPNFTIRRPWLRSGRRIWPARAQDGFDSTFSIFCVRLKAVTHRIWKLSSDNGSRNRQIFPNYHGNNLRMF